MSIYIFGNMTLYDKARFPCLFFLPCQRWMIAVPLHHAKCIILFVNLSSHPFLPCSPLPYRLLSSLSSPLHSSQRHRSLLCSMIEILRLVESQARLEPWPIRTWRSRGSLSGWATGEVWWVFLHERSNTAEWHLWSERFTSVSNCPETDVTQQKWINTVCFTLTCCSCVGLL